VAARVLRRYLGTAAAAAAHSAQHYGSALAPRCFSRPATLTRPTYPPPPLAQTLVHTHIIQQPSLHSNWHHHNPTGSQAAAARAPSFAPPAPPARAPLPPRSLAADPSSATCAGAPPCAWPCGSRRCSAAAAAARATPGGVQLGYSGGWVGCSFMGLAAIGSEGAAFKGRAKKDGL